MIAESTALAPMTLSAPLSSSPAPSPTLDATSGFAAPRAASFLSHLVDRPARAVMARIRTAAWHVLDLDTEFTLLD